MHKGFRAFVDQTDYEVSEIAIVTLLQAVAFDKDVLLPPLTALGRHQHQAGFVHGAVQARAVPLQLVRQERGRADDIELGAALLDQPQGRAGRPGDNLQLLDHGAAGVLAQARWVRTGSGPTPGEAGP